MPHTTAKVPQLNTARLHRLWVLRNNVLDLSIALDDADRARVPDHDERARLQALLDQNAADLACLIREFEQAVAA